MREKQIIVDGLSIKYYQSENLHEDGCLVFLHGWASKASYFNSVLKVCENYIALDLPGFGDSEAPKSAWSLEDYPAFLGAFINKLEIKNPILVGHSFGGSISIKYASINKVEKVILIASAGIRNNNYRKKILKTVAKIGKVIFSIPGLKLLGDKIRKRFYKYIDSEDYINAGKLKKSYQLIIAQDLRSDMAKIDAPASLIWGENDKDTPLSEGILTNSLIKNSRLFIIKNAGHFSFIDQSEEFNKIFLNESR